ASVLPFMGGSVETADFDYRQRLVSASWNLVMNHPFFGDQDFISKMQNLRQGQGIIDIVNTYAGTALEYGLVGLSLFVGFMLLALIKGYSAMVQVRDRDNDLARLGSCLLACIAGTMLMLLNSGFSFGCAKMFYVLAGLTTAYIATCRAPSGLATEDPPLGTFSEEAPQPS
ncbi:MAG TPA: hypothetical protein VGV09_15815, partial [Steroidobacteraceae bacterium]|nr:hypothetical protein [Steroidobacteraceae bacterium]